MKKINYVIVSLIILSFAISAYFYPKVPLIIASHWDAQGQVNGYMSRFWGVFMLPLIILAISILFIILPKIDPLQKDFKGFKKEYDTFIILFLIFMLAIQIQTLLWNLGTKINPIIFISIGIGILFFYVGILCENAKRNFFVGIRTPWSLSNDKVWEKTNKLGAMFFKLSGIIAILSIFIPRYAIFLIIIPIILFSIISVVYSYLEFRKLKK
ncbi:MAG: SdpI family protein [Nanoarchaeota archaeon]